MPIHKTYGWVPDLPDQRDHLYAAVPAVLAKLPPKKDLRAGCPPVYDQGQLGSCTANAISGALQFEQKKQRIKFFMPSRLFIYYNERVIEKSVNSDNGAQIRDGIKTVANQGFCPETEWPYNPQKFATKPSPLCFKDAGKNKAVGYQRLVSTNLNQLKGCIASGFPFVFGFTVYEAFESPQVAKSGVLNMPGPREKVVGGHAVLGVGYDDSTQRFIVRNSWGKDWGTKGYFTIPYAYLTSSNLADDFWTIRILTEA
ncbi:MAG: C1 family peptidase [Acidobacteriia bacterium]|nr:C1 family peptidase [Terriglobia bacterium]